MQKHFISIAHAAFSTAQTAPDSVDITSFTREMYALLSPAPTFWRVVGITQNALSVLLENLDTKGLPKGIQRAHICQRSETMKKLLFGPPLTPKRFEQAVLGESDHTILCAKGENNNRLSNRDDIIRFDNFSDDPLFPPHGFKARWDEPEKDFITNLAT